ncbi:MAG: hypothetical protein ACTHJ5_19380 [Ilyomonas sp.]
MKKKTFKKMFIVASLTFVLLLTVLAVHIYWVTRNTAPDATTRVMARMDLKQTVSLDESNAITNWLYQQKGIDHVLCNPATKIVVFTFSPVQSNANDIVKKFNQSFHVSANRYIPTEEELQNGCPVAKTSTSYKIVQYVKNLF